MIKYHYEYQGIRTANRSDALRLAGSDYKQIKFYFLDHLWDHADWSQEPIESFESLAIARCRELREQYDWLCLWLSAGYDSQTALKYFTDAGVKIDEIAYRHKTELYDDPEPPYIARSAEQYRLHHNPNLRFTKLDVGLDFNLDFYQKYKEQWIYQPGGILRLTKSAPTYVFSEHSAALQQQDLLRNKRADIHGNQKPRLDLYNNTWYMWMYDLSMQDSMSGDTVVDFYLPETDSKFFIKQCYMAIRFFENLPGFDHSTLHRIQSSKERYQDWNLALGRILVDCLESRSGVVKHVSHQSTDAYDSVKIKHYLESVNSSVIDYWKQGLSMLQHHLGTDADMMNLHIPSKKWQICQYGKYQTII